MSLDIAYVAGIIDGEGCISLHKVKSDDNHLYDRLYPRLTVGMTNDDVIFTLHKNFGGSIYKITRKNKKHKDYFVWKIMGQPTVELLEKTLPHLIVKLQQAKLAINY